MNAPDKIFLHKVRDEESSGYHKMWFESRARLVPSDEYIRKDALLEWAKEQKKDCERIIREHPEDESLWCERDKYDELIDKLNSL